MVKPAAMVQILGRNLHFHPGILNTRSKGSLQFFGSVTYTSNVICLYVQQRPPPPFVSRRLLRYQSVMSIAATGRPSRSIIFSKTLHGNLMHSIESHLAQSLRGKGTRRLKAIEPSQEK
ncbi:hypothetical protein HETIRDRAFT_120906 [Heterobasidion irregulare TC 32-1]|uniref:Uncharacterized protein n=1 Tax=Heterobasidion irregulare (strain TC 32-1) TaxID=747525 RepID=W4JZR4_HETIT|nr:uncharacterized protein HETIRDRAFT_120906 [Heterobasidion irregulare TC 32-1]ETW78331.1 hypothetical protein HETIRDRAFT_120906 [Heterobasidion irregulare TC 32-1]